jgi:hypothetical protein
VYDAGVLVARQVPNAGPALDGGLLFVADAVPPRCSTDRPLKVRSGAPVPQSRIVTADSQTPSTGSASEMPCAIARAAAAAGLDQQRRQQHRQPRKRTVFGFQAVGHGRLFRVGCAGATAATGAGRIDAALLSPLCRPVKRDE